MVRWVRVVLQNSNTGKTGNSGKTSKSGNAGKRGKTGKRCNIIKVRLKRQEIQVRVVSK